MLASKVGVTRGGERQTRKAKQSQKELMDELPIQAVVPLAAVHHQRALPGQQEDDGEDLYGEEEKETPLTEF
ncbi:hypothetical protein TYRP_011584 [Tyrophagus putrescentiae]|nr:hypothetical protein TYRP_011584 [Tyrophagus putrescentiae]